MKCQRVSSTLVVLALGLLFVGCDQSASTSDTDMHADSESNGHDSDHGHNHSHSHGHQQGEPLYGGDVVAIGHTHHGSGATHYHAEVMPVEDGRVTFHVLTDNDKGESEPFHVETREIVGYVDRVEAEDGPAYEVTFSSQDDQGGSTFIATLPEWLLDSKQVFVVVPKIQLGHERQNFSFTTPVASESEQPKSPPEPTEETSN